MIKLLEKGNEQMLKFIAFIIFWVGVFTINSSCNLIFFQPKESEKLKRFYKK